MKILILGVDGMIGHKIAHFLENDYNIIGSTRKNIISSDLGLDSSTIYNVDVFKEDIVSKLNSLSPDIIINCIGKTIRRGLENDIKETIYLNSKLPFILKNWVEIKSKKLIHFSSDCVFNGVKGNYLDNDKPSANDIYGKTKADGEVISNNTLTIRCSIIGREIYNFTELFEWLFSMKNKSIDGFTNFIYSGITNVRMAKIIHLIIKNGHELSGIYNISSIPISKHELLEKLSNAFDLNVDINENKNIKSNKVLISKKFTEITGINPPDWDELIEEFKMDCEKFKSLYRN